MMEPGRKVDLRFRLPQELFRSGQHLVLEVFSLDRTSEENVTWKARYHVGWQEEEPFLEPVAE
jgi:hypothetical protein